MMKRIGFISKIILALLSILAPFVLDEYLLYILAFAGIYLIAAQGLNVLLGFSGQISIGHAGFVAIGAYVTGLGASHLTPSLPVIWLLVILATAIIGCLLGWICLGMVGPYLALATIGFGVIIKVIATNWRAVTGGPEGIIGIPPLTLGPLAINNIDRQYYLTLAAVILTLYLVRNLKESRIGRAMLATRDDDIGAQVAGIPVAWVKITAFVLSAVLAGLSGSLYANLTSTVFPEVFDISLSALFIMILVIGGTGNIAGVTLGALIIVGFYEILRDLKEYQIIVYSVAVIVCIIYLPQGVMGMIDQFLLRRGWASRKPPTISSDSIRK